MEQTTNTPTDAGTAPVAVMQAETDFDRSDPSAILIAGLGFGTLIGLVVIILGIQAYFDHIRGVATYEKVMVPVADDLKNLHIQEDEELNTYKYVDRDKGIVQIPISRAMELLAEEAASNKLTYFRKPTPVKVPGAPVPGAPAPAAGQTPAAGQAPAAGPKMKTPGGTPKGVAAATKTGQPGTAGSSLKSGSATGVTGNQ